MIGNGVNISVFGEPWTADRKPILASDSGHFNPFLRVANLLLPGTKSWNLNFIHHMFAPHVLGSQNLLGSIVSQSFVDGEGVGYLKSTG